MRMESGKRVFGLWRHDLGRESRDYSLCDLYLTFFNLKILKLFWEMC